MATCLNLYLSALLRFFTVDLLRYRGWWRWRTTKVVCWHDALAWCSIPMLWVQERERDGVEGGRWNEDEARDRIELRGFGWFEGLVYRVRRETKKGRGYILVSRARHVRAGVGKLDRSPFFKIFEPVQVSSTHFSVSDIVHHFPAISCIFSHLVKTYQTK